MDLIKNVSAIAVSFALGSALYVNSVHAQEIENTKEKMPEIKGELVRESDLVSRDGKIKINYKEFESKREGTDYSHEFDYLVCRGVAEKRPFSVYVIKDVSNFRTDKLFLDLDRDGFVDLGGKLTGERMVNYIERHRDGENAPVINVAPKCK